MKISLKLGILEKTNEVKSFPFISNLRYLKCKKPLFLGL